MMRYADHQQTMCSRAHTPLPAPLCRAHRGQDHLSSEGPTKPVKALGRPASDDAMPLCLAGPSALAEWLGHSKWLCRTITLCLYIFRLSFSEDGRYLKTNRGWLSINPNSSSEDTIFV